MSIKLELIENGHILWVQVEKSWKAEDILPAKEKTQQIFRQAQHTIHAIADLSQAHVTLPLISASQQVIGGEMLPNSGQIAVVGVSRMMQMLAKPILQLTGNADTVEFFDTLDQAKLYLRRFIAQ